MTLTKVSYSMIAGAAINVIDYGADPTGTIDSTAAIQAALDDAITTNKRLDVLGTFLLTGTVHINKTSADRTPTYISGGGTFLKTNAGPMFDATNNATSEIFFTNIRFLGDSTAGSNAFACNQELIRTYFTNCSFDSLDVCFDSTTFFMQSFKFTGCDFSNIISWVVDCGITGGYPVGAAADISFSQCQVEGQSGGLFRGGAGLNIHNCVIENISGNPVFYFTNTGSVNITANYFEDCQQGIVICAPLSNCAGIVVEGNIVNLATGTKFIVWGKTVTAGNTIGNVVNGGQTNDTSQVTFGSVKTLNDVNVGGVADGAAANAVTSISTINFVPTIFGGTTAGTCTSTATGTFSRVGNVVTFWLDIVWSGHTGTGVILITVPFDPANSLMPVSLLPNGMTVPAGQLLSAAFLDGLPHLFLVTSPTDGASGTYAQLSLASHTSGGVVINGSILVD